MPPRLDLTLQPGEAAASLKLGHLAQAPTAAPDTHGSARTDSLARPTSRGGSRQGAGQALPLEPCPDTPRPPTSHAGLRFDPAPPGDLQKDDAPHHESQGFKKYDVGAPASRSTSDGPLPLDQGIPLCRPDALPHDLGHDNSPSLSDPRADIRDLETRQGTGLPPGGTRCGQCGAELPDIAAIDAHIMLHHPPASSVTPTSSSCSPTPTLAATAPPVELEPSASLSPSVDPAYPFRCTICRARYKTERGLKAHMNRLRHFAPLEETVHDMIGIPSGNPTEPLLQLIAATYTGLARLLPPAEALARLLAICRKTDGSGRFPPSQMLLRRGLLGRAWQAVQDETSQSPRVPEPRGEQRRQIIRDLHPSPMDVSLPSVPHTLGPAPKITAKALVGELKSMKAVATGPSGLGKLHLLYLCDKTNAAEAFTTALAGLLVSRDWGQLKPLAEFRLKLLPKPNGKWRPIAIQETLLVAFHRVILKQTAPLKKLPPWQLAFERMAHVKAISKAEGLKASHHLLTVDVRNAFNSVPHAVIIFSLHRARVPLPTVDYISSFLGARHSADLATVPAGVPQGDPLSMALFCQSIVWPVEAFLSQYELLAYADDLIVASPPSIHADTVKKDASDALAKVGLCVEVSKCTSTQLGAIAFMGTKILRDAPFNLGEQASRTLQSQLETLHAAELSRHDRLRLLVSCIVPSVNYGPLVDAYPGPHSYADVDAAIIAEVAGLMAIPDQQARALALTPRSNYGLGLVLPGHYHADMQQQRREMVAGTFRELRRKRAKHATTLRSFLPLALLRGPPLSNDQILFIGECLSGQYQKSVVLGSCAFCKQPMRPRHHLLCKAVNGIHVARHSKVLNALVACAKGRPGLVTLNAAIPINHLQPDLIVGDGYGDLVITVPWRVERSFALKLAKYKPLIAAGRARHILPVVIGTDGTIHPKTAAGLTSAGVDLPRFLHETALAILWHYTQSALSYSALAAPNTYPAAATTPNIPLAPAPAVTVGPVSHAPAPGSLPGRLHDPADTHTLRCIETAGRQASSPAPNHDPICRNSPNSSVLASLVSPSLELMLSFEVSNAPSPGSTVLEPPSEARMSEGPSPMPPAATNRAGPPDTQAAEPVQKQLPPIFRYVGTRAAPAGGDRFYPFKRVPGSLKSDAPHPG
ncbi:Reverse transcriptase/endonuclease, putative [Giardia lamblia P15]|uniref:Reverse transcriptase/endonuclease, putative n=1 Tax=Giardia intestinalis (strain P15) TaxID=658858 RepID=E1EVS9_GIAIA|nr:Reverse transcriptase/endonuclease, putative [Giardia lamblia P15]